ncbi:hypothetical protein SAMN05444422_10624 [Halobiforma haloterrestris]|uniref:Uncharacterized protein n=2 Tax=cellular organisms TaxID=131567 RepID=A0A1I1HQE4_NATHA|nr:hypothetical protein SAMN05444422_10624 [Halobiforma haloterrestris]
MSIIGLSHIWHANGTELFALVFLVTTPFVLFFIVTWHYIGFWTGVFAGAVGSGISILWIPILVVWTLLLLVLDLLIGIN